MLCICKIITDFFLFNFFFWGGGGGGVGMQYFVRCEDDGRTVTCFTHTEEERQGHMQVV